MSEPTTTTAEQQERADCIGALAGYVRCEKHREWYDPKLGDCLVCSRDALLNEVTQLRQMVLNLSQDQQSLQYELGRLRAEREAEAKHNRLITTTSTGVQVEGSGPGGIFGR